MRGKKYRLARVNSKKSTKLWVLIIVLVILAIGAGGLGYLRNHQTKIVYKPVVSKKISPLYSSVAGKYLFSGTIVLARGVETYANGNYNQPFSGMSTLGSYDARIGDLECPVTNNNVSYETEVNDLIFNCSPQWLPYLKKYFPVVNLSSNHLYDQGETGFNETVQNLTAAGFQTVGNYNPHIEPDDCKVIVLPVRLEKSNNQGQAGKLPIAFCSYNYKILFSPASGELESIEKWSKIMPVVALLNEGPEYEHVASAQATSIAHQMIDYGASFVVGNGTHWVQNTEVYKGKLIAYSLGNFIFDQLDYDGRIALNLSVSMSLGYNNNVSKWLGVGESCQSNTSNCLSLAQNQHLTKINPNFAFDAVGSYGGYLQVTTRANSQQETDIEQLANWSSTEQLLTKDNQN